MITSFLVIFFFLGDIFFLPKATKKILTQTKKNTHQQTKLLIQRKHVYTYDISFLCPPPILNLIYLNFSFSEKKNITPKKKIYHFRRGQIFEDLRYKFRNNFKSWYTIFRVIFFYKTSDVKNCLGTWRKKKISQLKKKYQH